MATTASAGVIASTEPGILMSETWSTSPDREQFRDVGVELRRQFARQSADVDLLQQLHQHAFGAYVETVEDDRNLGREVFGQVGREEIDMERVALDRVDLHFANEHLLRAALPIEGEERGLAMLEIELFEIAANHRNLNRAFEGWAVDHAGDESLASQRPDLLAEDRRVRPSESVRAMLTLTPTSYKTMNSRRCGNPGEAGATRPASVPRAG